jgi:protein involved in polysaccharide export with SLBB domain
MKTMRFWGVVTGSAGAAAMVLCPPVLAQTAAPAAVPVASGAAAPAGPSLSDDEYKLGIGDKLRVLVFNEETLSGEFQVSAAGDVALPLIGSVPVVNRTTSEVAADVRNRLSDGYLRDPRVSIEVLTYRPFFILGEVRTPAQYPYVNGLTVLNAIATAGGFTPRARKRYVYVRHAGETQEQRADLTPDLRVMPGDTIRVEERLF